MGKVPGRRGIPHLPPILIDTREQTPWDFGPGVATQRATLESGDYSLDGCSRRVCIERKSHSDAYSSVGAGRARFQREWERMSAMEFAAVVIEASISALLVPPIHSSMSGKSVVRTYLAWSVRYRVPVYFAGDRAHGAAVAKALLQFWWANHWFLIKRITLEQFQKEQGEAQGESCEMENPVAGRST